VADETPAKHLDKYKWKPGASPNPTGRPKGSRSKLGEAFLEDMLTAWETQGAAVIQQVIAEKPEQFLKVVAMILPKELHVKTEPLSDMTDDELIGIISALRSQEGRLSKTAGRSRAETKAIN
jgi:hypothetical protein